ncbi:MAG: ThiF family adenylyltransferase [Terriglobales bacterium]
MEALGDSRYAPQMRFAPLGASGQARLAAAHAAIVGCGALGAAQADLLARAGVGRLTLVDRDYVEASNLQRQRLFDEADAADALPKAVAAARRLGRINAEITVDARVADLDSDNIARLLAGAEVLLDGTDNFQTRYLLNDFAVARGLPWIYGAAVGSYGVTFTIRPGATACLQCIFGPQPAGVTETCETAGVLNWVVDWVAAQQAGEAIKLLAGAADALRPTLAAADLWRNEYRQLAAPPRDLACPCCAQRRFAQLEAVPAGATAVLCGRNAVQLNPRQGLLDLATVACRLQPLGRVRQNEFMLRFTPGMAAAGGLEMTLFPDGRAIIQGTADPAAARSLYARYIGA